MMHGRKNIIILDCSVWRMVGGKQDAKQLNVQTVVRHLIRVRWDAF